MEHLDVDSSLKGKSSQDVKQMMREQTNIEVGEDIDNPATSPVAETDEVAGDGVEVIDEPGLTPTEVVPPVEQPPEEVKLDEIKRDLHKLKVEGREEEVDYEKLIQYAQKGRHYEKEMSKLKEEKERLSKQTSTGAPQMPSMDKINEQFVESLSKDAFGTLANFYRMARENEKQIEAQERQVDKEFEREKKVELPHWEAINSLYRDFRDLGYDRDRALMAAERDFFMTQYTKAKSSGVQEGVTKSKLKQKAEIPSGEKKSKPSTAIPTLEEASKMTSADIAKHLKRHKVAGW